MSTLLVWLLYICAAILGLALITALLFFIGAIFYGMYKGVKELRSGPKV